MEKLWAWPTPSWCGTVYAANTFLACWQVRSSSQTRALAENTSCSTCGKHIYCVRKKLNDPFLLHLLVVLLFTKHNLNIAASAVTITWSSCHRNIPTRFDTWQRTQLVCLWNQQPEGKPFIRLLVGSGMSGIDNNRAGWCTACLNLMENNSFWLVHLNITQVCP